ncbi:prepilin-type N-terminal cleavage/methylation domain-containing protein [Yersinia enterocolitica]
MLKKTPTKNSKQWGFTLIESMVVMIVGVMILASSATGINKLFVANNVSTESQNIQTIAENMKVVASSEGGYGDINDLKTVISLKVIPSNMKNDGIVVKNVWGGDINITTTNDTYTLSYPSVPVEECIQIVSKLRNASWNALSAIAEGAGSITITPKSTLYDIQLACGNNHKATLVFVGH